MIILHIVIQYYCMKIEIENELDRYYNSFVNKTYCEENQDLDVLMEIFNISPSLKCKNKQYWGRELGKLWEKVINIVFSKAVPKIYKPAIKIGKDEPCDLVVDKYAIDTKYRIGSGDSGTLKKFKKYGPLLTSLGYTPVMLFLREDNLPAAIAACKVGGWDIYTGEESFKFIQAISKVNLKEVLVEYKDKYPIR